MICQYMGGNLTLVQSQEGVGSKFSVMIPILEKIDDFDDENDEEQETWSSRTPTDSQFSHSSQELMGSSEIDCYDETAPPDFSTRNKDISHSITNVMSENRGGNTSRLFRTI